MGVAINSLTHKVYAVDEGAGTVLVTDERTGSKRSVKVGKGPIAIAIDQAANRIYVVNTSSNSISVIDGRGDTVIATVKGGSNPYVIAVNEKTHKVYVTYTYSNAVTVIDGATNSTHELKTGSADGIAIDSRSDTLFLTTYEDPDIRIVDAATGTINRVRVVAHLWGITLDESSNTLYLAHTGTSEVVGLNVTTHEIHTISVGEIPCAIAVSPITHMIYAVDYGDETVKVIDSARSKVVATLHVGRHPQAIAIDAERNRIYVANVHSNNVTVIDGAKNTVIGSYGAGNNPYALAVDPVVGRVFAANYGEPAVTSVDIPGIAARQ
jgi:YVTN family beta-propeller protein